MTLDEDRDQVDDVRLKRWIQRKRREHGIGPEDAACWFVQVEQDLYDEDTHEVVNSDTHVLWLGTSPADALTTADMYDGREDGIGVKTLEVFGDGINGPRMLRVVPHLDEGQER